MSVISREDLKIKLDNFIATNGNRAITGNILNDFFLDVLDSHTNQLNESNLFGHLLYDPNRGYKAKETFMFNGEMFQADENIPPSIPDPTSKSTQKTGLATTESYGFLPWDPGFNGGLGYPDLATVERGNRIWKSNIAANTTDPLTPSQVDWDETSANNGTFGNVHVNGFYLEGQVITQIPDKLYYLDIDTSVNPFESIDLANEIIAGDWKPFNQIAAVAKSLAEVLAVGNNTGGSSIFINQGDRLEFAYPSIGVDDGFIEAFDQTPETLRVFGGFRVIALENTSPDIEERAFSFFVTPGKTRLAFDPVTGLMSLISEADLNLEAGGGNNIVSKAQHSFENADAVAMRIRANAVADHFINITTGALDDITAGYNLLLRNLGAGTHTMAVLNDLSGVVKLISEAVIVLQGATLIETVLTGASFTVPANEDGNYVIEFIGVYSITGDSDINVSTRLNTAVGTTQILDNNQGGGSPRVVNASINIKSESIAAVATDVLDISISNTVGTSAIVNGLFKVYKIL